MKYLIVLAVLAVAYAIWRGQRSPPSQRPPAPPRIAPPQPMVTCAHCGVHLPRDDALCKDGRSYCSRAHREHGPA